PRRMFHNMRFSMLHAVFLFQRNAIPHENSFSLWNPRRSEINIYEKLRYTFRNVVKNLVDKEFYKVYKFDSGQ
ncbi:MAG TPA: hypothetical protein VKX31_09130, partial [Brumimicrobium sp.]|nr:hypothetical protein [Brumimicrobium sp.]